MSAGEVESVTIRDPDNLADNSDDLNPIGSISYEYRIGKYEISKQMVNTANTQSTPDGDRRHAAEQWYAALDGTRRQSVK